MDGVIVYKNDGKEKYQSCEAYFTNSIFTIMNYSTIQIEAYGANLKESQLNAINACELVIANLQQQISIIKESITNG